MKFLPSQVAYLFTRGESRANLHALARYLAFLGLLVVCFAIAFHLVMRAEGQEHSWLTGFYWTLVVMTTLGLGDITFTTDLGRAFSILVLLSGVVFLLVMLPFLFVRLFYAPWLEARIRFRAPREVPAEMRGHVVLTDFDAVAEALVARLGSESIPYVVIEPDPARAAQLADAGVSVIMGGRDSRQTYERARAGAARLVVANGDDREDASVALTVREATAAVPIAAIVADEDAVDILEVAGATSALPLKRRLGESLANRAYTGRGGAHVIGTAHGVQIAELPARDADVVGKTVHETQLRARAGVNVIGLWQRGTLRPAFADSAIGPDTVLVLAGTADQLAELNHLLPEPGNGARPLVLVIGAGIVGLAAGQCLLKKGVRVHMMDRLSELHELMAAASDGVFIGNAANRLVLQRAGLHDASSVLLTTNDDATNIYLTLYCRKLRPDLRVVSRITHERNVDTIHRAGADFVLCYTSLAVNSILALLHDHESVLVGEGVELFAVPVPASLANRSLQASGIGSRTAMSVVAVRQGDQVTTELGPDTLLPAGAELLMLGTVAQRRAFAEAFEQTP